MADLNINKQPSKYKQPVLDHFNNPRNMGSFNGNDKNIGTAIVGSPACGDVMKLQLKIGKDDIIEDARFKTFGCGSAIASSSFASEHVKGKSIMEGLNVRNMDIAKELGLPPIKLHCSMLAENAIKGAIKNFKEKNADKNKK